MNSEGERTRKCDYCEETIPYYARRCPYCGSLLNPPETEPEPELVYDNASLTNDVDNADDVTDINDVINNDRNLPYDYAAYDGNAEKPVENAQKPLSNGLKVFITALSVSIPAIGQVIGVITSIVFLNSEHDHDRRSFGIALLVVSVLFFILSGVSILFLLIGLFTGSVGY
jgi:hypothetical protein